MAKTCALHTSSLHTSPQDTSPLHAYTFAFPLFAPCSPHSVLSDSPLHTYTLHASALHTCRCVNVAFETSLAEGLRFERAIFYSTFATHDQKAGMAAFAAKEKPTFKNE